MGPWEVMTPRSPALEGNATPLQGAVQQQKTSGSSLKAHYNGKRPCRPHGALLLPQHRLWPLTYRLPGLPFGSRGGSFLESAEAFNALPFSCPFRASPPTGTGDSVQGMDF